MTQTQDVTVILLAGGTGTRMGSAIPKQFLALNQQPIALYSFKTLINLPCVAEIVVVCTPDHHHLFTSPSTTPVRFALPGNRRQDSLQNGLDTSQSETNLICVHDAARPLITEKAALETIEAARKYNAAVVGTPVKCTIKQCDQNLLVTHTPNRSALYEIQTPQVIRRGLLKEGLDHVKKNNITVTDDTSLVELLGCDVKIVEGNYQNIKITTPEDLPLAELFLQQ